MKNYSSIREAESLTHGRQDNNHRLNFFFTLTKLHHKRAACHLTASVSYWSWTETVWLIHQLSDPAPVLKLFLWEILPIVLLTNNFLNCTSSLKFSSHISYQYQLTSYFNISPTGDFKANLYQSQKLWTSTQFITKLE